jgi:hypothetical protein
MSQKSILIKISEENANKLAERGEFRDTWNTIITRVLAQVEEK